MPAERAGYTVTMFLVDVSPSMAKTREVEAETSDGSIEVVTMTNLQWALQFVKLKIQDMIFTGRKTDQCGVILFGTEETKNVVNARSKTGGYDNVSEYIPIGQPNAGTLAKLSELQPGPLTADPIDALIVGIETQALYLASKKTWTRKMVLVTDGENPMEIEDWDKTVQKMNQLSISLTVVGIDFDDDEFPYKEENKSVVKHANEAFYDELTSALDTGVKGTCAFALQETARPDIKMTKSTLVGSVLRLGDYETRPDEAVEILVKYSKCTALARPKGWKRFGNAGASEEDAMMVDSESGTQIKQEESERSVQWRQLKMRTEYYIAGENTKDEEDAELEEVNEDVKEQIDEDQLVRGFKYGSTYVPCPEGQFPKMATVKGIDICGFFQAKNFRRDQAMGEVYYVWADPGAAQQQIAMSSIVQAMSEKNVMAIGRWVNRDDADPKMGVLSPCMFDGIDCFLWTQMPFADDVRKYTFPSLEKLVNKDGHEVATHPYLPTEEQASAMDNFVDAMDLMDAGEKDEEGNRGPWFDTRMSYNPAIHRTKQALFHGAIIEDLNTQPLGPPHPEIIRYFEPPRRALKRARDATQECIESLKVKQVPRRVAKARKDDHALAHDDEDEVLLLDQVPKIKCSASQFPTQFVKDESDDDDDLLLQPRTQANMNGMQTQTQQTQAFGSESQAIDRGRVQGRIIGRNFPLEDFQKNLSKGDLVTKAVEDLAWVVQDTVTKPFAARRHDEMIECLQVLRSTALKEDEIDAWNLSLRELKHACHGSPGNRQFWSEIQNLGPRAGLISVSEAKQYSGISDVSDQDALEFLA